MIEGHVRTKIQPWFDKLGTLLHIKITPNLITIIALFSGIISGVCISAHCMFSALGLLWLSGLCDVMDGTVARITNRKQAVGAFIDLISDRMVEAAIILGFTFLYPQYYLAYILFFIALLLHFSTFVAAGALMKNNGSKSMHHEFSLVERAEAFIVFSLMMLFPEYIFVTLMSFNVIIFVDGMARFYRVMRFCL